MPTTTKTTLKEGDIIQALKDALPKNQLVRFTPGPGSPRGISDVLITWNGIDWFCEIKVNDRKITRLQAEFLRKRTYPAVLHYFSKGNLFKIYIRNADIINSKDRNDWETIMMMLMSKLFFGEAFEVRFQLIQQLKGLA